MATGRSDLSFGQPAKGLITASHHRGPNGRSVCIHASRDRDPNDRNVCIPSRDADDPNRKSVGAAVPIDWVGKSRAGSDGNRGHMHNRPS